MQPTDFNATSDRTYITTNTPGLNVHWDMSDQSDRRAGRQPIHGASEPEPYMDRVRRRHRLRHEHQNEQRYTGGVVVGGDSKTLPYWTAYGPNTVAGTPGAQSANFLGPEPVHHRLARGSDHGPVQH